jgi:acyl-coenzyme A thioesterase PaaI-like protein
MNYFVHALENELIIADTSINKKGKQIVNAQYEIWNADRRLLSAKGYSNLLKIDKKK